MIETSEFERELEECKDYIDVRCSRPHQKFTPKMCNKLLGKIKNTNSGTQLILRCPSCKKNTRVTFQ